MLVLPDPGARGLDHAEGHRHGPSQALDHHAYLGVVVGDYRFHSLGLEV